MTIERASKKYISEIAEMRMSYKSRISAFFNEIPTRHLIEDYFSFYLENYQDGFLVFFEQNDLIGYIIITDSEKKYWNKIILKGYLIKWLLRWIKGYYGISIKSVIKSLLRTISCAKVKEKNLNILHGKNYYIASIGVKLNLSGKGFGKKILEYAFEYANQKGANNIWLKVGKDNIPAIKLFQKSGFITNYEKNNFLIMYRTIKN